MLRIWFDGAYVHGPKDLASLSISSPDGSILVRGKVDPNGAARWAGPIGAAVLRGASVSREVGS